MFATEYEREFEAKNLHGYPSAAQIPDAWDIWISSPAVVSGKVYFGSGDGNVYAVDATSGLLQWKFRPKMSSHSSPAVVNNVVYIGSWDRYLYALDAETGQEKWAFKSGKDNTIHNQVGFSVAPYGPTERSMSAAAMPTSTPWSPPTGKKKWDYPTSKSWVDSTPAVRDGLVYAATSDSFHLMKLGACFNFDAKSYVFSSAALAGELAYVGDHNGKLYAIDAKTGKLAWDSKRKAQRRIR